MADRSNAHQWCRTMLAHALVTVAESDLPEPVVEMLEDKKVTPRDAAQVGYGAAVMAFQRLVKTILEDEKGQ